MASLREIDRCRLQLVASRGGSSRPLAEVVHEAIDGGVDLVQLREKNATTSERVALARDLLRVTAERGVPLLINDDVEAAHQLGAAVAGVHLGQDDLPVEQARARLGPDAWIGLSTHSEAEILRAESSSATHFGLGACFPTATKEDHRVLARAELERACARNEKPRADGNEKPRAHGRAGRPLFAIGGITVENVASLVALGVKRVAVSGAILASDDPRAAAAAIRAALGA